MWPFSRKKTDGTAGSAMTVAAALEQLANTGVGVRPGIAQDDLLYSLGGSMESPVDWVQLLCALGSEVERADLEWASDDIWHFDAECIEDNGDYVTLIRRFVTLAKGTLPLADIRDHVNIEEDKAWVEFVLEGRSVRWDLKVSDDWVDPELYSRLQQMVA